MKVASSATLLVDLCFDVMAYLSVELTAEMMAALLDERLVEL
jgi:hypothetical protein